MGFYKAHLFFCTNQKELGKKCCQMADASAFCEYAKTQLKALNLFGSGQFRVSKSGCLGRCACGPCLVIYPDEIWYTYKTFADIDEIIEKHLMKGEMVGRLLLSNNSPS